MRGFLLGTLGLVALYAVLNRGKQLGTAGDALTKAIGRFADPGTAGVPQRK